MASSLSEEVASFRAVDGQGYYTIASCVSSWPDLTDDEIRECSLWDKEETEAFIARLDSIDYYPYLWYYVDFYAGVGEDESPVDEKSERFGPYLLMEDDDCEPYLTGVIDELKEREVIDTQSGELF